MYQPNKNEIVIIDFSKDGTNLSRLKGKRIIAQIESRAHYNVKERENRNYYNYSHNDSWLGVYEDNIYKLTFKNFIKYLFRLPLN